MASAQEIYLGSSSPAEAPVASATDVLFNGWNGKWDERVRQWKEAQNEYNAQKLLTAAEWEREDTQYQRLVNDLKAAGINPYYALNQSGVSLGSTGSGQSVYSTKGKSSKKDEKGSDLKGLIASALLIAKLLA